jgi:hypothetical protein
MGEGSKIIFQNVLLFFLFRLWIYCQVIFATSGVDYQVVVKRPGDQSAVATTGSSLAMVDYR